MGRVGRCSWILKVHLQPRGVSQKRMILLDLLGLDSYHFWGSGWILSQTASHHASDGLGHGSYGTPRIGSVEPTIPGEGTGLWWWWLYVENMDLSLSLCIWEGCVIFIYRYILYTHAYYVSFALYICTLACTYTHNIYIYIYIQYVNMYYSSVDYCWMDFPIVHCDGNFGCLYHPSVLLHLRFIQFQSFLSTDSISLYGHIPTGSNLSLIYMFHPASMWEFASEHTLRFRLACISQQLLSSCLRSNSNPNWTDILKGGSWNGEPLSHWFGGWKL